MTTVSLRYFATVARRGSIREAAEELHVAQSALSRQIQKLEQEFGVPLFQRHARGVELTSAGEIFLRHARSSLRQTERVRSELDALKGLRRGTITIQSIESLVPGVLPQAIMQFRARHPGITFEVTVDRTDRIITAVREGRTDIGLAFYPPVEPDLTTVFKMREPLVALMSPRHPLAGRPKVSLADSVIYPIALAAQEFRQSRADRYRLQGRRHLHGARARDEFDPVQGPVRAGRQRHHLPFAPVRPGQPAHRRPGRRSDP